MGEQQKLTKQAYTDIDSLTPLSKCVMSRQATINIGTIGHVSHGKTTVVQAISGIHTIRFGDEKRRNITIRLGYANAKIFQCPKCPKPKCFKSFDSKKDDEVECDNQVGEEFCGQKMELVRHVSFVDCPGHEILMAKMLTGAAVMDAAILLIAGDKPCPQPQTSEHLAAVDIMQLNHIIILQNKVDLIFDREGAAQTNHKQIVEFVRGTRAENSPIVPISAQFRYNIDYVLQYIVEFFPIPERKLYCPPRFIVIRSFDVNKPGCTVEDLQGGVAGGTLLQGFMRVGDLIEIRPGIIEKNSQTNEVSCTPIYTRVISLKAESNQLLYAIPGGLIGMGLKIDPFLTRADRLCGSVIGYSGSLPEVYKEVDIEFTLLGRLLGVMSTGSSTNVKVQKIQKEEILMINVGSIGSPGKVLAINTKSETKIMKIQLLNPVCSAAGEKVALSRRVNKKWRLIGWGNIKKGKKN